MNDLEENMENKVGHTGTHSHSFDSTQVVWPVLKLGNYLGSSRSDITSIYQTTSEDGGFKLTNQEQVLTMMDLCIWWIEVTFDILSILAIMDHRNVGGLLTNMYQRTQPNNVTQQPDWNATKQ